MFLSASFTKGFASVNFKFRLEVECFRYIGLSLVVCRWFCWVVVTRNRKLRLNIDLL